MERDGTGALERMILAVGGVLAVGVLGVWGGAMLAAVTAGSPTALKRLPDSLGDPAGVRRASPRAGDALRDRGTDPPGHRGTRRNALPRSPARADFVGRTMGTSALLSLDIAIYLGRSR